jgi:hypothetical protein
LGERALGSTAGAKGKELPSSRGWQQFPALPSAPARVHINDQHTNFQIGKLRVINGNN